MFIKKIQHNHKRIRIILFTFLIISVLPFYFFIFYHITYLNNIHENKNINQKFYQEPKISAGWAWLNLTNVEINNTWHRHNDSIVIEGRLFDPIPPQNGFSDYDVAILLNRILYPQFSDTTNSNGDFQILFVIPFDLDIYSIHKIQVNVTESTPGDVDLINHFNIYVSASSIFDIDYRENIPKIPGEDFRIEGFLRYDNINGSGIPNAQINYHWLNGSYTWPSSSFFTNPSDGSILHAVPIPIDAYSQTLNLNLSYSGDIPYIGDSEILITYNKLFSDIIFDLNIASTASVGDNITITGEIFSINNNSLKISNRTLIIRYDGTQIDTTETNAIGVFTYTFRIPSGIGNRSIQVELVNTAGKQLTSINYINVTAGTAYNPSDPGGLPPFLLFSLIFFPILAVVVGVLTVLGIRFYKRQEKESRVVIIPLESRLINLKILKDSGRLEESISYLFNAIYMDLINAKYGRARKENETIRDFAIISVKELRLTPAGVYPFIQRVEAIIYAKPFKITENDFYNTCELFSPIYFQLTGYNFTLNF